MKVINSVISFEIKNDNVHFNDIIEILFNECNPAWIATYKKKKKIKIERTYKKRNDITEIHWKIIGINVGLHNTRIPEMEKIYSEYENRKT